MLDEYESTQPKIYKTIINSINNKKISHAYIIETNGNLKAFEFAIAFAKTILCPKNFTSNIQCKDCNQCKEINNNEFIELKIIESEGQWIKKNQLDELQYEFSKKAIIGKNKVYIIKDAEKMNISSSNAILKFLEEPAENVTAILLCSNVSNLLPTIVSRCQILSLNKTIFDPQQDMYQKLYQILNNSSLDNKITLNLEEFNFKVDLCVNFIKNIELYKEETLVYVGKLFNENFVSKEEIYYAFEILLLFYKDILNSMLGNKIEYFSNYSNEIEEIKKINDINSVILKINVIIDLQEKIKFNINSNMLMDKLIIELGRCG